MAGKEKEKEIRIFNAALDDSPERGGTIIMRGVVNPEDLKFLLCDDYQREAAPMTSLKSLVGAFQSGDTIPDIILGMRGERTRGKGTAYTLLDHTYIIDGQQRVNAAKHVLSLNPQAKLHLGATVHFNTEKEWERDQFRKLNLLRQKVSPNVLLRNERDHSPAVLTLFGLNADPKFALRDRVCWGQNYSRGHLLTALILLKVAVRLHRYHSGGNERVGRRHGNQMSEMIHRLDNIAKHIGLNVMRENVLKFFDLVDEFWGLRSIQQREMAVQTRGTMLGVVAALVADHTNFWTGPGDKRLFMDADTKRKFRQFSLADPAVVQLSGSSGQARNVLYKLLLDHINSGRRVNRLKPRAGAEEIDVGVIEVVEGLERPAA